MSQWGKRDRIEFAWLVQANNNSNLLTVLNTGNVGNSTSPFTVANGFVAGNKLFINANVNSINYTQNTYVILSVLSGNTLTLDTVYTAANTNVANLGIQEQPKGKIIHSYGWGVKQGNATVVPGRSQNTITARNVYGIDRLEANVAGNKANGFNSVGWLHYKTWTTSQGMVRHRVEPLVAMSKNFNANATGVLYPEAFDNYIAPNS